MEDRPLRRMLWQDRKAILEHLSPPCNDQRVMTGKCLAVQPKSRPNYVSWVKYDNTDILQARGTVTICCPADLMSC